MKSPALAATASFSAVAVSAALICAPGAAARTAAPGAEPGAAARPAAAAPQAGSGSAARTATPTAAAPRTDPGSAAAPQVRVDQVGYPPAAPKTAFVMLPRAVRSVRFAVQGPHGGVYLTGRSSDYLGRWNASYGAVYKLDFSAFRHPGTYRIKIISPARRRLPRVRDRQPAGAVSPAGAQRGSLFHLRTGRRQRRPVGTEPQAGQPHRPPRPRVRRPAI